MATNKSFLGVGWGFPPAFDSLRKSAVMVAAEDDIAQSLRILMGTTPGERVMQPTYGCNLRHLMFEVINQSTLTDTRDVIERAIRFFEPRITLNAVVIDDTDWIDGLLRVLIDYTIVSTNTRTNLVYPVYLREGSAVGYQA